MSVALLTRTRFHLCPLLLVTATMLLSACAGGPQRASTPRPADQQPIVVAKVEPRDTPYIEPVITQPVGPPPIYGENTVRVGILLPLSGRTAALGEAMLSAAQLALFDISDNRIVLLPRDTGGTPDGAAAAAQQAIDDGAQILLGPVFAESIRRAGPVAQQYRVPLVGYSTDRSVAGNGTYIIGFTPEEQVDRVVAYAMANGRRRFAAMIPDTAYGAKILTAMRETTARRGGVLVHTETYTEDEQALYDPVRRLAGYDDRRRALEEERAALEEFGDDDFAQELLGNLSRRETYGRSRFDAVLLPSGGPILRAMAPLLAYYDIDPKYVKFLGTGLWDDPNLRRELSLEGAWYAGPSPQAAQIFSQHFGNAYQDRPPRVASLAYDSVALIAALVRKYPREPFTERALRDIKGFAGIDGIFRFGPDGVAERGLAIVEITPDGMVPIDPAPSAFGNTIAAP